MEEYDWGEFAVITSLLPGYDTFVDIVESYTDTSYFLWNLQDILTLEMSVGANDARTKRMLQQVLCDIRVGMMRYTEWVPTFIHKSINMWAFSYIWLELLKLNVVATVVMSNQSNNLQHQKCVIIKCK